MVNIRQLKELGQAKAVNSTLVIDSGIYIALDCSDIGERKYT